jgi:uroporphyrinogen decarboxylase
MCGRQLVIDTINNKNVNKVPIAFWHHYIPNEKLDAMIPENEKLIEQNLNGHKQFIKELDGDIVKIMSDGFFCYRLREINTFQSVEDFKYLVEVKSSDAWMTKQIILAK